MSEISKTLGRLDARMRQSATARALVEAAEQDAQAADTALRGARLEVEAERKETEKAHGLARQWEQTAEELRSALEESHLEAKRLKQPRRETRVQGETVEYSYFPAQDSNPYGPTLWTIGELDSALMHLRVAGADDDTQVRSSSDGLTAEVRDDGGQVSGWSYKPEPDVKVSDRDLLMFRLKYYPWWVLILSSTLTAVFGFALGGA